MPSKSTPRAKKPAKRPTAAPSKIRPGTPFEHYLEAIVSERDRKRLLQLLRQNESTFYRRLALEHGSSISWLLSADERRRWKVDPSDDARFHGASSPAGTSGEVYDAAKTWASSRDASAPPPSDNAEDAGEAREPTEENEMGDSPELRALLILRFGAHIDEFAARVFPHFTRLSFSRLHHWLIEYKKKRAAPFCPGRVSSRLALAAPRGAAKSTFASLIFPLYDLLYQVERYTVLIAATRPQAERRLAQIRSEIKGNAGLAWLFPKICGPSLPKPEISKVDQLKIGGLRIDAKSAGTEIRGLTDGPWRPTHVVLDDSEPDEMATSPHIRENIIEWFHDVVEPLGDAYTHLTVVGTLLHPEALLPHLLERPDFETKRFASVVSWSRRSDLWEEWRRIYCDLGDKKRRANAGAYYRKNRKELLHGAEALWPEKEDYLALMKQLATMGRRSFFKEKQNEPRRREGMLFDPDTFRYFSVENGAIVLDAPRSISANDRNAAAEEELLKFFPASEDAAPQNQTAPRAESKAAGPLRPTTTTDASKPRRIPLEQVSIVGFLDAATGAAKNDGDDAAKNDGDDAAIAVVGRDGDGQFYLLDIWMKPALPTQQVAQVFEMHRKWKFTRFAIEGNCFQAMMRLPLEAERRRREAAGEDARLPIKTTHHNQSKEQRIAALEPDLTNGWLAVNRALPTEFLAQAEQFPHVRHDDGLDAAAAATALARATLDIQATKKIQPIKRSRSKAW